MLSKPSAATNEEYSGIVRLLIRYAVVMGIMGLLVGIAYQESAHKLPPGSVPDGVHLAAIQTLSLAHGHIFTVGVFLPLALAGALVLGLRAGGRPIGARAVAVLKWGFLPFAAATLLLQLYKGYFILLAVRGGQTDMAVVQAGFLGGSGPLRYGLYAVLHSGMGIALGTVLVALWRSLGQRARD